MKKTTILAAVALLALALTSCTRKTFCIYDAMHYQGKPASLLEDKLSPVTLIYEAFLIGEDTQLDMAKVDARIKDIQASGINTISTDIEEWYESRTGEEMK